ncbi:hypothetical protein [Clostridium sp. DJ247]|uniref:hypothetical protein n=1 Tax=Clostridium sp. DJ247 TaxID=2726188 RepID=UPI00162A6535|nr:hypothetical protein [Clostridium sp. DJ247]MBC2581727.1 hypothetical protein [Clostridium sp. DJ247]
MKKHNIINISLTICFFIIQVLTTVFLIVLKKHDYILEILFVTFVFLIYTYIEFKYQLYIHNYIKAVTYFSILCHTLIGEALDFYVKSYIYDKILHILGTYAITLFIYALINQIMHTELNLKYKEFLFIFLLGISLGTFFEIAEFIIDITIKPKVRAQTNLVDTNLDLIFNALGSLISALHLKFTNFKLIRKSNES